MAAPPPPDPFPPFNTTILPAGTQLVRLHDPIFEGDEPNPCKGKLTRFAPLGLPDGSCLPTLYAASSFECAVHESVFHDLPYNAPDKFIAAAKVTTRAISWLEVEADLVLVSLREPDLNRLNRTRAELIDTRPSEYAITARWAEAFHKADPDVAGIGWTSRRCDPDQAYVFFGDRLPSNALIVSKRVEVADSAHYLEQIRQFGRRADITLTL